MTDLPVAANVAQVASLVFPIIAGGWGVWRKIDRKQVEAHYETIRMSDKLDVIEKQFGPNGGGLREAVNNISIKLDKIESRQQSIGDEVARLTGKFDQHIKEN